MNQAEHSNSFFEINYGGLSKEDLLKKLKKASVELNEYAKTLFCSELFEANKVLKKAKIGVISVKELGFSKGATLPDIIKAIESSGFSCCPLEIAPYLRLAFLEQKEEFEPGKNKAPAGSITIISKPVKEMDDFFPKGFYIRKIEGTLWLRGFVCSLDYVWNNNDLIAVMV